MKLPSQRSHRQLHGPVLFLDRDPRNGRIRRHASADPFRPFRRNNGNLYRDVVAGRHDGTDLRAVLAAACPLCLRPESHRDDARPPADPDDPCSERAPQYALQRERHAVAHPRRTDSRRPAPAAVLSARAAAQENPGFALTWTIFHVIDRTSPLFGLTAEDLASTDAVLVLTVSGDRRQLRERAAVAEGLLPRRHCPATSIR